MMKAYEVRDNDANVEIVFAKHGVVARRKGANYLDTDFSSIEYCRRRPALDKYAADGVVPIADLLALGWWFECHNCYGRVEESDDGYVISGHAIYCCQECHNKAHGLAKSKEAA